ncbi:TPA: hypothetical protein N0F65_005998 [Lagenidium giganteum]|uniref:Integrase catalytic domain-containing protein n=1 Tax=Lagenidium giganteum TaxID=4803 RepID=A0AAV2ZB66_9STRA|nr:TPA: hypothetical protein N0F65_005998 [Lagenidium giganteum]
MADADMFSVDFEAMAHAQKREVDATKPGVAMQEIAGGQLVVDKQSKRTIVPASMRKGLMTAYHQWLIHPGAGTMHATMAHVFVWPNMERALKAHANTCTTCYKSKDPTVNYGKLPLKAVTVHSCEFKKECAELLDSYDIHAVGTTVRNPQANAIVERVHRVIGDKMRATTITTPDEWEGFLHNVTFSLRASHHSTLGSSPAQAAFGRDMLVDIKHVADWAEQHARKVTQIQQNSRENAKRTPWLYAPDDKVFLRQDGGNLGKLPPMFKGHYTVLATRENGTLVLDKGTYVECVSLRRVIPFKA